MKKLILRLAHSRWLKIAALLAALISGIDDLVEAWLGVHDLFGLDVAHGVVITALTGILDPLSKFIEENEREIHKYSGEQKGAG